MKSISRHAATAKAIRKELKDKFPAVKFSVKSDSYSGGTSVRISWQNGPTYSLVQEVTSKYQYGSFDSMRDLYEYSNPRDDIPQVRYVQHDREITKDIIESTFIDCKKIYAGWEDLNNMYQSCENLIKNWRYWTAYDYIVERLLESVDLTNGYDKEKVFNEV